MPLVTLITDFGYNDYYLGALKGVLLAKIPTLQLVDISHEVAPYDIIEAAYILKNCFEFYPADTLHVVCVNNDSKEHIDYLLVNAKNQWILAPDNGFLSLILEEPLTDLFRLEMANVEWSTFHHRLALQIKSIFAHSPPGDRAKKTQSYNRALSLQPVTSAHEIRGTLVHIDRYGNLVSNIPKQLFEQVWRARNFSIGLKPNLAVRKIVSTLDKIPVGEPFAIFNAAGYLTFGICKGRAASLHSLEKGASIQIEFVE